MDVDITRRREHAHALLDLLPPQKLSAVHSLLEVLVESPLAWLTTVEEDTEELSPETIAEIRKSMQSLQSGELVEHEEILKEFGLEP